MRIVIAASRRLGYFLVRSFCSKGHDVTLVNASKETCTFLARKLACLVICGDPTDPAVLEDAGIYRAEAFLGALDRDEDNLVACQVASNKFGVGRALAVVSDPDNVRSFTVLGIEAFSATEVVVSLVEQRTSFDTVTYLSSLAEGRISVAEIVLPPNSPAAGRKLRDTALPPNALVASIVRGDELVVPRGETVLMEGDKLTLLSAPADLGLTIRALDGGR